MLLKVNGNRKVLISCLPLLIIFLIIPSWLKGQDVMEIANNTSVTPAVDSTKSTSIKAISEILAANDSILVFSIQAASIKESIRLMENYQYLTQQQTQNQTIMDLRKSIKRRTYVAVGIGLASSSLFLLANNNNSGNSNKFRISGAAFSLAIPIISLLSLKKQLNNLAPINQIDYSQLQTPNYPYTTEAKSYFNNHIKSELFKIEKLSGLLIAENQDIRKSISNESLEVCNKKTIQLKNKIDLLFISQLRIIQDLISRPYVLQYFDNGTNKNFMATNLWIENSIKEWQTTIQKHY